MNRLLTAVFMAGALLAASQCTDATRTIYVDASMQASGDGSSPQKAFRTIQEAACR